MDSSADRVLDRWVVAHVDPLRTPLQVEKAVLDGTRVDLRARRCEDDDAVVALAMDADVIMCLAYPITDALMSRLPDLRLVVRYGVGVDNIDAEAASKRGIVVCNVPDYCIDEVANHTVAMLLTLNRRLLQQTIALRQGASASLRPMGALRGQTVGLVGLGRLARAVADRLRPFGVKLVAYDPVLAPGSVSDGVEILTLDEVLTRSHFLSLHVPLTPQTKGMIGEREMALMPQGAYVVNTARGGVVDETALHAALISGHLGGAGIDAWEHEPVRVGDPLLALENVVATNHTAFYSDESLVRLRRRAAETVAEFLSTGTAANAVNNVPSRT